MDSRAWEIKGQVAIGVMAKAPLPGVAKTRLATLVGDVRAAQLHRVFLLDTLAVAGRVTNADLCVVCPDEQQAALLKRMLPGEVMVLAQRGRGLMPGLASALEDLLRRGYQAVVLSDADSPTLPPERFAEAFALLEAEADVVLGPCEDGGYYLIGARRPQPELFDPGFRRDRICQETAERAQRLGLRVQMLKPWYDVDEPAELARLVRDLRTHPDWAPISAAELVAEPLIRARLHD